MCSPASSTRTATRKGDRSAWRWRGTARYWSPMTWATPCGGWHPPDRRDFSALPGGQASHQQLAHLLQRCDEHVHLFHRVVERERRAQRGGHAEVLHER